MKTNNNVLSVEPCQNQGETGNFEINSDSQLKEVNYNLDDYSLHLEIENQFYQKVEFYVPKNEYKQVIAVINDKQVLTGFYDCSDFKKDSDYLPVTFNNKVYCYFSYHYASSEHYYPKK